MTEVPASSLSSHVERLLRVVRRNREIPTWDKILVMDTRDPRVSYRGGDSSGWRVESGGLQSIDDYAARFDALLHAGYSWVNLSLYGLYRGDLVLGVETPSESTGVPFGSTSVNYSGPSLNSRTGQPIWELSLVVSSESR